MKENLLEIKNNLLKMGGFLDVEISNDVLTFGVRNTLINFHSSDDVMCSFSLKDSGDLLVQYTSNDQLIQCCQLIDTKISNTDGLLNVMHNREKFLWKCTNIDISENYEWLYF